MNEERVFNPNEFVLLILKEIPFFEVIPLPGDLPSEVVFNVKTRDLNEATRVFYRNSIPFTTVVVDEDETYLEANIKVEFIPIEE